MSESKHTPGPWQVARHGYETPYMAHAFIEVEKNHEPVAGIWWPEGDDEQAANAALIARAPELMAERDAFVRELDPETGNVITAMANLLALRKRVEELVKLHREQEWL